MQKRNRVLFCIILIAMAACRFSPPFASPQPNPTETTQPQITEIPQPQITATLQLQTTNTSTADSDGRTFETDKFSFTIPGGWKTQEEVWGRPMPVDADHYGLGLSDVITIQYPPGQREGTAFFSVATSPLAGGVDLEGRFNMAYENPMPEIKNITRKTFERNGLFGFEITYDRPWGKPWWRFHDIWLEKDAVIYMLSSQSSPDHFDTYADTFDSIVESFKFK